MAWFPMPALLLALATTAPTEVAPTAVTETAAAATHADAFVVLDAPAAPATTATGGYAERGTAVTTATMAVTESTLPPQPVVNFAGRLLERGTRRPIPDAQVVIADLGMPAFTDKEGRFEFEDLPEGEYDIVAPVLGFQRFKTRESISETERTDVVYYLEPDFGSPLEVIVEAEKVKKEVSKTVLRREELRKVAGTGNDAIRATTVLPGVASSNELGTDLLVRGSGPFDNRIEIDRISVPFIWHNLGLTSVLNSNLIDTVDFQAGGFGSEFGRATGGVLLANTRAGRSDRVGGTLDVNTLLSEAFVEGPAGEDGSFILAGRRSYYDLLVGPVVRETVPRDQLDVTVFPQFYDYQGRFDYRLTTDTSFNTFLFGADDIMRLATDRANPRDPALSGEFYVHTYFHIQSAGLTTEWENGITNRLNLYHQFVGQDLNIGQGSFIKARTNAPGLNNDLSIPFGDHRLNLGAQLRWDRMRFLSRFPQPPRPGQTDFTFTDAELIDSDRIITAALVGLYAEDVWKITDEWMVIPGLRFDYYNQDADYAYVDPRFATRWQVSADTALKAAVGRYSDFPSETQLDKNYGDPSLKPFQSYHYVAGVEQKLTQHDAVDVQAYYKTIHGMPWQMPITGEYTNSVEGRAYGFEVFLRHYMTERFFGWISYAWSRSLRMYPDTKEWEPAAFDQPHIVNVLGSYRLTPRWELGFRWRYGSGNLETPYEDRIFLADKAMYIPVPGDRNSERLPAQHRLDARIEYSHPFNTWTLRTYLEVMNTYMAENAVAYNNNYDYTSKEPLSILPIPVPILGIRAEF